MAQAPVAPDQDLAATDWETDFTGDEAVSTPRDEMVQRPANLMAMIFDLTHKVRGSDPQQMERAASPLGSPATSKNDRRRAKCQAATGRLRRSEKEG